MSPNSWNLHFNQNKEDFLSETVGENKHIIDIHMHLMGAEQFGSSGGGTRVYKAKLRAIVRINVKVARNFMEYEKNVGQGISNNPPGSGSRQTIAKVHAVSQIIDETACPLVPKALSASGFLAGKRPLSSGRGPKAMSYSTKGPLDHFASYYGSSAVNTELAWFGDTLGKGVDAHVALRGAKNSRNLQSMNVIPWFFAPFDPRRKGGLKLLKMFLAKPGCIGVKLYSRNGWSPDPFGYNNIWLFGRPKAERINKKLKKLYAMAEEHLIPLLCHTSPGGWPAEGNLVFPEEFKEHYRHDMNVEEMTDKYDDFTVDPRNWRAVLERHRNLQLCLGHIGGGNVWKTGHTRNEWQEIFKSLMTDFDHVYGDVSFWIDNNNDSGKVLERLKSVLKGNNEKLARKILFGSDWYLTMSEKKGRQEITPIIKAWDTSLKRWHFSQRRIRNPRKILPTPDDFFRENARRFIKGMNETHPQGDGPITIRRRDLGRLLDRGARAKSRRGRLP